MILDWGQGFVLVGLLFVLLVVSLLVISVSIFTGVGVLLCFDVSALQKIYGQMTLLRKL